MGSPHYTQTGKPRANKTAFAQHMRAEFELVEAGMQVMALGFIQLFIFDINAHGGENRYYKMPAPYKCDIVKVWRTISAANGGANTATWVYNYSNESLNVDNAHIWSVPSTAVAGETHFFTADQNHTDQIPFDPANPGITPGGIVLMTQGQGTPVVPMYVTALIRRVN